MEKTDDGKNKINNRLCRAREKLSSSWLPTTMDSMVFLNLCHHHHQKHLVEKNRMWKYGHGKEKKRYPTQKRKIECNFEMFVYTLYLFGRADAVPSAVQLAAERPTAMTLLIFLLMPFPIFHRSSFGNVPPRPIAILRSWSSARRTFQSGFFGSAFLGCTHHHHHCIW